MSEESGKRDTGHGETGKAETGKAGGPGGTPRPRDPGTGSAGGPEPEALRFFGTTWVDHDHGYALRRAGVAAGSLAAAAAGCFVLRFAYQGLEIAKVGSFVNLLVVVVFAVCSAIAFRRTWESYGKRLDPQTQQSLRSMLAIGFIGMLLAYFFRSLTEAPGEKLRRAEYETARTQYERRTSRRTRNPAARSSQRKRKR
ncbi:EamA/RhaT family transporter [Streptomyces triticagri]|uniref:EamA/RhaT family transporter n=1 Tax=Streptomyces triticagri TaxID=2293568 RepID=A0A372M8A7_9ACTN|nr:EamA/RhaT family transporter [Streptomyces triticagri]RFU87182.1 EamA/RhaT family transporter [Streptomyces triticagri]